MMACERYAAIGLELGAAAAAHKKNKSGRQTQKKETKESRDSHGYQSREMLNTPSPPPNRARMSPPIELRYLAFRTGSHFPSYAPSRRRGCERIGRSEGKVRQVYGTCWKTGCLNRFKKAKSNWGGRRGRKFSKFRKLFQKRGNIATAIFPSYFEFFRILTKFDYRYH